MTITASEVELKAQAAKRAARRLATTSSEVKNAALRNLADGLRARSGEILAANAQDVEASRGDGLTAAKLDRLTLNEDRLEAIAKDVRNVVSLPDPVGEMIEMRRLPNGMQVGKMRVPFGVIGAVYENRPNVTVDIASLCLKAGSASILRGGKEALRSNMAISKVIDAALSDAGAPAGAVQIIESSDRAAVAEMLGMKEYIDLVVPRGGEELIRFVEANATMPVLIGGIGVCHTYVDEGADLGEALEIVVNAKVQRPTVCNALDTVLVHSTVAGEFLPALVRRFGKAGVEMRCDDRSLSLMGPVPVDGGGRASTRVLPANDADFGTEFLDLIASVKMVDSVDEAMEHIARYGSGHSEAIVTEDSSTAERFLREVDAAAVFVNASTRFNDGGEFGLGAEVAISTNKLHARGPMGLREITTYKWVVRGQGQVRT